MVANTIAFTPDNKVLFAAHTGGEVILWDLTTGKMRGEPLASHKSGVFRAALSPDGRTLALGRNSRNGELATVVLTDITTRTRSTP